MRKSLACTPWAAELERLVGFLPDTQGRRLQLALQQNQQYVSLDNTGTHVSS